MSSFDKVIKGACKPKAAPPKSKYLDSIIAATWNEEGAVHDVCKALSPKFREPNAVVVFKALIVLHTMIRNGATDNVLGYLSTADVLKLRNVSAGNWEGYSAPQNLQNYATYLDARVRGYKELKHDAIRVQSESNRDMRNSVAIEDDTMRRRGMNSVNNADKRKTIMGRKLRIMTVEKGLLRETKVVQKMINALVECRFYLDNLEDELNITTLRMLVKDLLILFQACNEGVINVLEHYFEMSHVDATQALNLYRNFCKQAERVTEYLGVAKKLQNLLNVSIPNLSHAPVSLAGALEEYLNDPNFEQNRIEYKTNKEAVERRSTSVPKRDGTKAATSTTTKSNGASTSVPPVPTISPAVAGNKAIKDFFAAIEVEQPSAIVSQQNSASIPQFQQHAAFNPFSQGDAFGTQPMQTQQTGFMIPQNTQFQTAQQPHSAHNPFNQFQLQQSPMPFLQPQPTSFGPIQPQTTGANPFRQSMAPQMTGAFPFSSSQQPNGFTNAFLSQNNAKPELQQQQQNNSLSPFNVSPFGQLTSPPTSINFNALPPSSTFGSQSTFNVPPRPSSAPLSSLVPGPSSSSPPEPEQVKSHQTGSRNPFGIPTAPPPPVPKVPTMMELAMSMQKNNSQQQQQPQQTGANASGPSRSTTLPPSTMSNIASDFSFLKPTERAPTNITPFSSTLSPQTTSTTSFSSPDTLFSSLSSQPTGTTANTNFSSPLSPSISTNGSSGAQSNVPGVFTGLKPFKPSSSFGAQLLGTLPPIPQSTPGTPSAQSQNPLSTLDAPATSSGTNPSSPNMNGNGSGSVGTGFGGSKGLSSQTTGFGALNSQPTGAFGMNSFGTPSSPSGGSNVFGNGGASSVGVGLRPQMTGGVGIANPFRASTFGGGPPVGQSNGALPPFSNFAAGGGGPGTNLPGVPFGQNGVLQQQQQQQHQSLI